MSRKSALDKALNRHGYRRMAPHKFDLPDACEWFDLCGLLTQRRVAEVERLETVCKDILIKRDVAQYILRFVSAWKTTRIGKHYVSAAGGLIPPLPIRDDVWLDAITVGRAIFRLAKRDMGMVRHVLSVFAIAANLDRQIVLTVSKEAHLHYARILISFVQELEIDDLEIGLVAYENENGMHANLRDLCGQLGLDPNSTSMRTERARNFKANSPTRQAGIEVLRVARASSVTDQAFFCAMILGAAVEVWRFALPAEASETAEASDQQVFKGSKPIDPKQKLPPASARPSTDRATPRESFQRDGPN